MSLQSSECTQTHTIHMLRQCFLPTHWTLTHTHSFFGSVWQSDSSRAENSVICSLFGEWISYFALAASVFVCQFCEFWIYISPARTSAPTRVLAGTNIKETGSRRARFRFREGTEAGKLWLKPCLNVDYGSASSSERHAGWRRFSSLVWWKRHQK